MYGTAYSYVPVTMMVEESITSWYTHGYEAWIASLIASMTWIVVHCGRINTSLPEACVAAVDPNAPRATVSVVEPATARTIIASCSTSIVWFFTYPIVVSATVTVVPPELSDAVIASWSGKSRTYLRTC